jgi:hypothetical protein
MSNVADLMTPYEQFLRQNLESERKKAESVARAYATARGFRKIALKRELDQLKQNVELLSGDLEKYEHGLDWLREPTKERDEKAEHLKPVPAEALASRAAKAPAPAAAPRPAPAGGARPQVGSPVSNSNRPVIGQPTPSTSVAQSPSPQTTASPPRTQSQPAPAASGSRPRIGTPIGTPVGQSSPPPNVPQSQPQTAGQSQAAEAQKAPAKRPTIGTPIAGRPRIGTPLGAAKEESSDDQNKGSEDTSSS